MNAPRHLNQDSKKSSAQPGAVIKFDMRSDDNIRGIARKGYEIAKRLKDLGIKFKKIIPAATDATVKKQFRLPNDSDLVCIELNTRNKTEEEKQILISDAKDQLAMLETARIIDEGSYTYDSTSIVYRLLLKFSNSQSNSANSPK